jgi:KduI/IolB family
MTDAGLAICRTSTMSTNQEKNAHQEVYHWRFNPKSGFGAQLWYSPDGDATAYVTRDGDTFAFSAGYHPTVRSPFHESYTSLLEERSENFDSSHRYLIDRIPGIAAMREKFKKKSRRPSRDDGQCGASIEIQDT